MLTEDPRKVIRRVARTPGVAMTPEQVDRCKAICAQINARVPIYWQRVGSYGPAGGKWVHKIAHQMRVIATVGYYPDGKCWIHASIARADKMASYEDLCKLKEEFLGADAKAIQVFPPAAEHVNIHTNCLHLFSCVDDDGLPDFTMGSKSL